MIDSGENTKKPVSSAEKLRMGLEMYKRTYGLGAKNRIKETVFVYNDRVAQRELLDGVQLYMNEHTYEELFSATNEFLAKELS